jgi:formate dehydrogenase major subunit
MQHISTTCPYCGVGCALSLNVDGDRIVSVSAGPEPSVNQGALCSKGRYGYDFVHHPDRLTAPLIRRDGELVPASWDEALGLVAERLGGIAAEFGPQAVGGFSSARCTNEENYLFQKLFRAGLGSNNVDHCARL